MRTKRGKAPLSATIKIVYRSLGRDRRLVWLLGFLALVNGVIDAISLYLVARLATALTDSSSDVSIKIASLIDVHLSISGTLVWSAVAVALLMMLSVPLAAVSAKLSAISLTNCRVQLMDSYLGSSWAYRSNHTEGHLQHLVAEFTPRIERFVLQLSAMIVNTAGVTMSIAAAIVSAPAASVYFVVGLGLIAALYVPLNGLMAKMSARYLTANRRLTTSVAQSARLAQEIEAFHVAEPLAHELRHDIDRSSEVLRRFRLWVVLIPSSYQNAALAVVLGVVALLRAGGSSQLAVMGPVLLLLVRALIYARQLQFATQSAIESAPYAVELDNEVAEMRANPRSGGLLPIDNVHHLEIENISFSHVPGQFVLHDLSISLPFGEVLGVAGPSGVGKSTLLQLLLRLRPPTSGRISVNGEDLRDISAASWAAIVAFVPQDNKLIRGTIAENIAFLRPFDREAIEHAAQLANLSDEVMALPQGFDTEVGPGARDLSGGQKQRLGIARALVGSPQLLILDEPTSALDPTSEGLITSTIRTLRGLTTVVIVAHRAETLAVCDRVIHLTRTAADRATAEAAEATARAEVAVGSDAGGAVGAAIGTDGATAVASSR